MIGFAGVLWVPRTGLQGSASCEVPFEGALGIDLLDRRSAEVDLEAEAAARFNWIIIIRSVSREGLSKHQAGPDIYLLKE